MVRKCKTNFASSRRKPDIDSFSTSGDIWARRWLRWHDLVSPCENVHEKNFFSPNDSKWSNSRKKHVSRNSKIFCPYDLTLARHLENFRPKIFSTKKKFFFRLTILNGPIREKNMFPKIRKIFALMTWPWLDT